MSTTTAHFCRSRGTISEHCKRSLLSDCHTWKLFLVPVRGHFIANPGSSCVCFLGSQYSLLTHSGKGSLSSRIALPGSKPLPLLLSITWEICREEPVFRRGGWHQHGNAIATEELNKLQSCHSQSLSPSSVCHQTRLQGAPPCAGTQCHWQQQETFPAECCEST